MKYKIVEKLDRAGGFKNRERKHKEWDLKYGENNWEVVYKYKDKILSQEEALDEYYNKSYFVFMKSNPSLVQKLCNTTKQIYNPHALNTRSVDLQCPAVLIALKKLGYTLKGTERTAIGAWGTKKGYKYPNISYDFSPFKVPLWCDNNISIENFWQDYKYLAIKNE